jgi:hypothetical protein
MSLTGMAFDPETGDSYQLNESARLMLTLLQNSFSLDEITAQVSKNFGLSYEQALTDVLEFQVQLKILGLAA